MNDTQREQFISFRNKAAGWLTVAFGATLLAVGETWDITEHYEWPQWVFWALLVFMMASAVLNTALRMIGSQNALRAARAGATPAES